MYLETRLVFAKPRSFFCRILFHIISLGKHFPINFFNFLQEMIWVCNDIIAILCETIINIKIERFELSFPTSNYLFKFNNWNRRRSYEICSKLTIETPKRCQWRRFGVFIVNLEHISRLCLTLMFTVDFEQSVVCWNWTNNVQLHGKLSKADTYVTKTSCPL